MTVSVETLDARLEALEVLVGALQAENTVLKKAVFTQTGRSVSEMVAHHANEAARRNEQLADESRAHLVNVARLAECRADESTSGVNVKIEFAKHYFDKHYSDIVRKREKALENIRANLAFICDSTASVEIVKMLEI